MKAAVLYTPGPPENLTVTTIPDPALTKEGIAAETVAPIGAREANL